MNDRNKDVDLGSVIDFKCKLTVSLSFEISITFNSLSLLAWRFWVSKSVSLSDIFNLSTILTIVSKSVSFQKQFRFLALISKLVILLDIMIV